MTNSELAWRHNVQTGDIEELTASQQQMLDSLPPDTRIYTSDIVTRRGCWYTIQCRHTVLARRDDLTEALIDATADRVTQ